MAIKSTEFIETMRAQFKVLQVRHAELLKLAKPHRDKYEAMAKQIHELENIQKQSAVKLRPLELEASTISNEMAAIARALKGKTGE